MGDSATRVGIIGLSADGSWASRSHLPYLQQSPHYTITALQNSSKTSAEKSAQKHALPSASTYDSTASLAIDPAVDLILLSVKVPAHYDIIKTALTTPNRTFQSIFVEWPLAANLKQAIELTDLARKANVRTMVGLQARQNPSIRKARELVNSGELGSIISTTMHGAGLIFPYNGRVAESYAYLNSIEAGANLLTIPAGHAIDALCYVLGELSYVSASLANVNPTVQVTSEDGSEVLREESKTSHDYVAVQGELVGGGIVSVTYAGGTSTTGRDFVWEIQGTKGTLLLEGTKGHVQMWQPGIKFAKAGGELEKINVKDVGADFSYNVGQAWHAFAGKGDGCITMFEDAVVRHRMIEAIYRSNESGTREKYL